MEMICTIVRQLTQDLTPEEIKQSGFDTYYVDHTLGLWPAAAAGIPHNSCEYQSKGDAITDLFENMAAEQKARTTYDNILRLVKDPEVRDPLLTRAGDRTLPALRGRPAHRDGKTEL